jgi:Mn-dependent DtxR family transcriptional regulator
MNQIDERILEMLENSGLILTPTVLAANLDYERSWVSERLGKLRDAELVERVARGKYRISEKGRRYLTGEIDASELEDSGESRDGDT